MSETTIRRGGLPVASPTLVSADQVTIGGDGSEARPLHVVADDASCDCQGPCEFRQAQAVDALGAALSGNMLVRIDDPNPEDAVATQLNQAPAGTFTRVFQAHLETTDGVLHTWATLVPALTGSASCADPSIGPPAVSGEGFLSGVLTVTVTFDTDAGATKTYASGDSVFVDVQVTVLGFPVPLATKTYTVS